MMCVELWGPKWLDEFWSGRGEKGGIAVGKMGGGRMQQSNGGCWECVYCIGGVDGGREGSNCCMGRLFFYIGPPLSRHFSSSLNSWTQYVAFK